MDQLLAAGNIQSWIDVGFVVVVILACLPSLLNDPLKAERRSGRWKEDLLALERTLRDLIKEAGAAGANLDRSLLTRQRELEQLVFKLDKYREQQGAPEAKYDRDGYTMELRNAVLEDELPNATWGSRSTAASSTNGIKVSSEKNSEDLFGDAGIESLAEKGGDRVSLSASSSSRNSKLKQISEEVLGKHARRQNTQFPEQLHTNQHAYVGRTLADQIDVEQEAGPSGILSHLDPVTYKIARRMLLSGQELHIVARKLELPLAELRILDKMLRQSSNADSDPLGQAGRNSNYSATPGIRREVALL
jgi:hypothetical protein